MTTKHEQEDYHLSSYEDFRARPDLRDILSGMCEIDLSNSTEIDELIRRTKELGILEPSWGRPTPVQGHLLRKRTTKMQRIGSWSALVIPSKRRKEIVGDFLESIQLAREQGMGRFGLWTLIATKFLLYAWVVLKLRIGDLVASNEDKPQSG